MGKRFNVDGLCYPDEHYMVNIDNRLEQIQTLIDDGKYFVMNRARQYGKTTTLYMLAQRFSSVYQIFSISFEGLGSSSYKDEWSFCRKVYGLLYDVIYYGETSEVSDVIQTECYHMSLNDARPDLRTLSNFFSLICKESEKPVIFIIDEVDQASNQEVFLDFLGMLRDKYMKRRSRPTFRSVILAGVYDIKNLKLKIKKGKESIYNSPWNIAAKFTVDMNFSPKDIAGMLTEYKDDRNAIMDIDAIAQLIYDYTGGYPFLVSRICQLAEEATVESSGQSVSSATRLNEAPDNRYYKWTNDTILDAVKQLLNEQNTLFDDMGKKLSDSRELDNIIRLILFNGKKIPYSPDEHAINLGTMFGYLKNEDGLVAVSNRIFETRLYNRYLSEDIAENKLADTASFDRNQFTSGGILNMDLVMKKFMIHFTEIYGDSDVSFLEEHGRRIFLTYLKPIINGVGNYYIEARTRDLRRTDVVIDYLGQQQVVEMKIWHGEEYNRRGELQLVRYLDDYALDKGYLLSFNFNKNKKTGMKEIHCNGKTILEVVV